MLAQKTIPPKVSIIPTVGSHIAELKKNLRPEDATEILRFGETVQHALWYSYRHALICKTAFINGEIAAIWGVHGTLLGKTGTPFLMTSAAVHMVSPLYFARTYQREVLFMLNRFQMLENYVDSEYAGAIRMLEIIGFTVEEPQKIRDGMYRKFWLER